jgi:hypothetical protein
LRIHRSWIAIVLLAVSAGAYADNLSFTTFVPSAPIATATGGQTSTIAFTYAGNKFVGSVYNGDFQLYQTPLVGGTATAFSSTPVPGSGTNEVVLGASLGNGGFTNGNVFAGVENTPQIYQYSNAGTFMGTFATLPGGSGGVRQIFMDPGSTFGGDMLVSTTSGNIYKVTSAGVVTPLASVGEDTEGLDIAPSDWGPFAGDLMVTSEGSGTLRLITPGGVVTVVGSVGLFSGAETVSAIPDTVDAGNTLEGFYVANFPVNIQFANLAQFQTDGILGDVIVTDEFGGSTAWDVHYNVGPGTFTVTPFTFTGNPISQFEDGIFVTPQRVSLAGTPEPSGVLLLMTVLVGVGVLAKRRLSA